ncbi:hypothetical protein ACYPKM_00920 [Pseudomonas aeruginosa]
MALTSATKRPSRTPDHRKVYQWRYAPALRARLEKVAEKHTRTFNSQLSVMLEESLRLYPVLDPDLFIEGQDAETLRPPYAMRIEPELKDRLHAAAYKSRQVSLNYDMTRRLLIMLEREAETQQRSRLIKAWGELKSLLSELESGQQLEGTDVLKIKMAYQSVDKFLGDTH